MTLVSPETGLIHYMAIRGGRVQALACATGPLPADFLRQLPSVCPA